MRNIIGFIFYTLTVAFAIKSNLQRFSRFSETERKERKKEIIITLSFGFILLIGDIVFLISLVLDKF